MRLTDDTITNLTLPPGKTEAFAWDSDIAGFGVRKRAAGRGTWVLQYRVGARSRRFTIGAVAALKASAARATATTLYAKVKLGQDPAAEKAKGTTAIGETFAAGLDLYLSHQAKRLRPRRLIEVRRHLLVHAKPLHRLPLAEIDRRAVSKLVSGLAETAGPTAANRTGSSIAAFFSWAIREGWIDHNAAATLDKQHEQPRNRVLSDAELRAIWKATNGADQYSAIVRLLLLTGVRREEVGSLRWSEVDLDAATITLPPKRTKNAMEHIIPLSALALEVLEAQPRREGRDFIFGDGPRGYRGFSHGKTDLDARTRITPGWVIHDLRRTFSTRLNGDLGIQPHVVEACLGHHQGGVASIYNRASYQNEMRQALALWNERVAAVVEERVSKVVPIRA